jgi:hypothetical protein
MTINEQISTVEAVEYERDPIWGAMSHPALDTIAPGSSPWKDHIYIAFWDPANDAYGFLHWNSSPNHDTTKVQANLSLRGQQIDIIEPLTPQIDRFSSDSAEFDLKSHISYHHERLTGTLTMAPQFAIIDFGPSGSLPNLADNEPLQHFEQGLTLTGRLNLDGQDYDIDAVGFRTRTWGYRDDSQQFAEYFFLWATFDDYAVGFIKQLHPDGSQKTGGGLVRDGVALSIVDAHLPKNRAGFAQRVIVDLADGTEVTLHRGERVWGGWCPIGLPERNGPAFSAFDEIVDWTGPNDKAAFGLSEYGQIRNVY